MSEEINTFSAAVDRVVARSGRLDRRNDILSYVRLTLREIQTLTAFMKDLVEDQLTATSDPYVWETPVVFRKLLFAEYPNIVDQRRRIVAPRALQQPGRATQEYDYFMYPSGDSIVFAGMGSGGLINVAYLSYVPQLAYFAEAARPATYDVETLSWSYLSATTDEAKTTARGLVTNWILFNWFDVVVEGALAKLYKTAEDPRSSATFALYKQLQNNILAGEGQMIVDSP